MIASLNNEFAMLSELELCVFECSAHGELVLTSKAPEWLDRYFAPVWDADQKRIGFGPLSSVGAFISYVYGEWRSEGDVESTSIIFEEAFVEDLPFSGQIYGFTIDQKLYFVIKQGGDLDTVSRNELQAIRQSSLDCSNFKHATDYEKGKSLTSEELPSLVEEMASDLNDGILLVDRNFQVLLANSMVSERCPEIVTHSHQSVFDGLLSGTASKREAQSIFDRVSQGLQKSVMSVWEFNTPYKHKVDVTVSPIRSDDIAGGTLWTFRERRPEEKLYSDVLTESEKLELVGRLAGGVAHDFNNLLAVVLGNITLMQQELEADGDDQLLHHANVANQAAEKAASLVRQLLGFSGKARLSRCSLDVLPLVEHVFEEIGIHEMPGIRVNTSFPFDLWSIDADRSQIHDVLRSVLDNAVFATEETGSITINGSNYVLNDLELAEATGCAPGHYVILTVSDNGVGMEEETLERIFEPFFTTKEVGEGTGLGMANAKGIIRQHGGHISCTSERGEGTTLSIYLPRHRVSATTPENRLRNRDLDTPLSTDKPTVLVVDDEELLRNLVRTFLEKCGYQTIGASDGVEGWEILQKKRDQIFAAVFDLAMPNMTGTELYRRVNQAGMELPVIIASGYLVDADEFCKETGGTPTAIFSKPYQLTELRGKIDQIRDESGLIMAS
ncbi:MAG: ATP-binding protein [Verrucomicrobiota bacterium]